MVGHARRPRTGRPVQADTTGVDRWGRRRGAVLQRRDSQTTSDCQGKGRARYYDVVVADEFNKHAAWYYPDPKAAAAMIKGYVSFGDGIDVQR